MNIHHETLQQTAAAILQKLGSSTEEAAIVAEHLVEANLKGHDSHGVGMLVFYVDSVARGTLKANQDKVCVNDFGAILQYDAQRGFGQRIGKEAVAEALTRVADTGVVLLTVKNAHHLGRIGSYGEQVAAAGKVGLFFVNVVDNKQDLVAPFAGSAARFGTNPVCVTFPATAKNPAFVLDFATSMVAYGKTRVAYLAEERFAHPVMLDANGTPTNDPRVMHEAPLGALRPIAEHKGGGLISAVEFLSGMLSGGGTNQPEHERLDGIVNHMTAFIVDPTRLADLDWLNHEYDQMIDYIKSSPAPGEPILMAGEPELARKAQRQAEGITISEKEWAEIIAAGERAAPYSGV